jgi:hypothetical protein
MRRQLHFAFALLAVPFLVAVMAGCSAHVGVGRSYDPYYHDYHTWSAAEGPYYNSWSVETGHAHVDYQHLHHNDQQAYWKWRHDHPDHQ